MSFETRVAHERERLIPLFKDARNKQGEFKKKWRDAVEGSGRMHFSVYKKADVYLQSKYEYSSAYKKCTDGLWTLLEEYKQKKFMHLDTAFAFLSINIHIFRSGYLKQQMCEKLKNASFTEEESTVLEGILFNQILHAGREFNGFVKLVPCLKTKNLEQKLLELDTQGKKYLHSRVIQILERLKLHK